MLGSFIVGLVVGGLLTYAAPILYKKIKARFGE